MDVGRTFDKPQVAFFQGGENAAFVVVLARDPLSLVED